ncbi:hypothetical protein [Azospirillum sp. sgz302134]
MFRLSVEADDALALATSVADRSAAMDGTARYVWERRVGDRTVYDITTGRVASLRLVHTTGQDASGSGEEPAVAA